MPRIRLLAEVPEGGHGNVVSVSRSRAQDLVNGGQAVRVVEREPQVERATPRPAAARSRRK